jgi:hypothetical protein
VTPRLPDWPSMPVRAPKAPADALPAIQAAIDAAPSGSFVDLPEGDFLIAGTIQMKDKPVILRGAGGTSQAYSGVPFTRDAATRITSVTNAPLVRLYETNYASIESQGSGLRDLALEGATGAGAAQHGVVIDNRGTGCLFENVQVAACGGHGWLLSDCVAAAFVNCMAHHNAGDGFRLDQATGTDGANAAVTNSVLVGCDALANAGNGVTVQGNAWGNLWVGGDCENNTGRGFVIGGTARFNATVGMWVEGNVAGSVRIAAVAAIDNHLDFVRVDATPTFAGGAAELSNSLSYSDLSLAGRAQRRSEQLPVIRGGGLSSTDQDHVAIRDRLDGGDGSARMRALALTFGIAMAAGDEFPASVPALVDAINLPHGRGLTSRNAANNGNVQIVVLSGTTLWLAAVGIATEIQGDLRVDGGYGFGVAPAAKPTVAGSRGGNAALASLLTGLAARGLITDSTTA